MTENAGNGAAHLQLEQVDSLVEAAGTDGAMAILGAFQRSTEDLLNGLEEDISKGALPEASRTAHAVKGSAANVGAAAVAEAASSLEEACKANDATAALNYLQQIKPLYVSFVEAFKNRLS